MKARFLLLLAIVFFGCLTSEAQVGARVSYLKFSGDLGYLFKPTAGYELYVNQSLGRTKLRLGGSIGYARFSTREDTLRNISYTNESGSLVYYEAWEVYSNVDQFHFFVFGEYHFIEGPLTPVLGLDIGGTVMEYDVKRDAVYSSGSSTNDKKGIIGFLPRIGVCYNYDDYILAEFAIGKHAGIDLDYIKHHYWKIQLGVAIKLRGGY